LPLLASGHTVTVSHLTPRLPIAIASVVATPVATPLVTFTNTDEDHGKSKDGKSKDSESKDSESKDGKSDDTHKKASAHSSHSAHVGAD
jgi:hypothetical protein